jgi:hypothetical protein
MALAQELTANDTNDQVIKRLRSRRTTASTSVGAAGTSGAASKPAATSGSAPRAKGNPQPLGEGVEGPVESAPGATESFEEVENLVAPRWWTSVRSSSATGGVVGFWMLVLAPGQWRLLHLATRWQHEQQQGGHQQPGQQQGRVRARPGLLSSRGR